MPAYQQTAVRTYDIDTNRRDYDVSSEILQYLTKKNQNEFVVLMARAGKEVTNTSTFYWYDDPAPTVWTQINNAAGYAEGITDLIVDDASVFVPDDVIKLARTDEQMLVTGVNLTTNTITVVRGYGSTAAAAILDNDWILNLTNAAKEGANMTTPKNSQPTKFSNITMITKTAIKLTGTNEAEKKTAGGDERKRLQQKMALEHTLKMERHMIFGEFKDDTTNDRRVTRGIRSFIAAGNVFDAGGALTEAEFEAFCEMLFAKGSSTKYLVCAPKVFSVINQFAAGKIETTSNEQTYGLRLNRYISAHGDLYLLKSKTFEHDYNSMALGLDMENIKYRPLVDRDTKLQLNIQAPDYDGYIDQYMTEWGVQVRLADTHAILKGVTG